MRVPNVPTSSIKLMLFPFSLEGAARIWLEKEAPRSILTWDDLVSKFINQFFPPSKTTNLHNEITRFQQRFDESFYEAWERFNDVLRACPRHGFFELHQLDTIYNALNINDQDSLNSAAGGNFLDKMPRECLKIIESKSKVLQTRAKEVVAKVSTSSSTPAISSDVAELKDMVRALLLDKKNQSSALASSYTPTPVKAVKPNCVTCDGSGTLPSNIVTNPKEDLKSITTRSGVSCQGHTIPNPSKQGTEVTKDQVQTPSSKSTAPVQSSIAQSETQTPMSKPIVAPISVLMPNLKPSIPHPSRRMDECLALADLGTSINLMPLSVWEELSLPKLTPTCMTLELMDRSVSKPIGIAKDVSVKVDTTASGNPTSYDDPIVSTTSPTLTPFGDSDFLLFEEADSFLEVEKLLDAKLIYPVSDSRCVSPVHCVSKKGGFTVVENEENELILTRLVTGWLVCIDYQKLNESTRKDHFPLPFMDQMLERLAGNEYYCFLDGFFGYFQIHIDPRDQEKTTFTCPYAFKRSRG
nr:reverse transcriptase domain-containing protein [Tanacetum cinerariifolium]